LALITATGARLIPRRHSRTGPARLGRYSRSALGWRWILSRERRREREHELRLLPCARALIITTWLAGENSRHCPAVRDTLQTLGNAAFDADLIGAWDRLRRPCTLENPGGHYRFGLPYC
jgi:hypothetical protein